MEVGWCPHEIQTNPTNSSSRGPLPLLPLSCARNIEITTDPFIQTMEMRVERQLWSLLHQADSQQRKVSRALRDSSDAFDDLVVAQDPSDDEGVEKGSHNRTATDQDADSKPPVKKKRKQPTECFLSQPEEKPETTTIKAKRRKKKKISDVLQKSAPKPGVPADLQNLLSQHFAGNRSVIEMEELKLSVCPKWAKLRRNHKEKKSVVMLVICSSALRSLELIKSMTAFKGDCRVLKLFAKHIKIKEQMNMLEKGVFHIGVGTPGRVKALVDQDNTQTEPSVNLIIWKVEVSGFMKVNRLVRNGKGIGKASSKISCCLNELTLLKGFTFEFQGDVFMYYGLQNFYQNHRRYVISRSDAQLLGRKVNIERSYCAPFTTYRNGTPMAPCGAIANSMFNDTIDLFYNCNSSLIQVPLLRTGNSWWTDKNVKFRNPESYNLSSAFAGTARPPYWRKPVYMLDEEDERNNGYVNDDFIIWMRVSAFATFRNLYRRVRRVSHFEEGLPAGNYTFHIAYSILSDYPRLLDSYNELEADFPVTRFKGRKHVILSTVVWSGGSNPFLGIAYVVSGTAAILMGFVITAIHLKLRKKKTYFQRQ
ncbi:cms1 ribosomal small subunit [Willisornis vidua]|uniref:Cell cycle control protein 50C n=1 Tax=Willisornis vidua TaxID=1566151 RepID=A0ABQ9DBC1_9PASS|nr:cms1 ribosomal small subunit [Willisornis vidua]